jgi:hypothetical protein
MDLSPYAEHPAAFAHLHPPAPVMPPRLPFTLAAAAVTLARAPDVQDNSDLQAAVEARLAHGETGPRAVCARVHRLCARTYSSVYGFIE